MRWRLFLTNAYHVHNGDPERLFLQIHSAKSLFRPRGQRKSRTLHPLKLRIFTNPRKKHSRFPLFMCDFWILSSAVGIRLRRGVQFLSPVLLFYQQHELTLSKCRNCCLVCWFWGFAISSLRHAESISECLFFSQASFLSPFDRREYLYPICCLGRLNQNCSPR